MLWHNKRALIALFQYHQYLSMAQKNLTSIPCRCRDLCRGHHFHCPRGSSCRAGTQDILHNPRHTDCSFLLHSQPCSDRNQATNLKEEGENMRYISFVVIIVRYTCQSAQSNTSGRFNIRVFTVAHTTIYLTQSHLTEARMNSVRIGHVYSDLNSELPEICVLEILKIETYPYLLGSNSP